jgi:hypothetical protein
MLATSIILSVFQFLDQIYKSLIGVLWYTTIYYGLNPHYTFLLPFISNNRYEYLTQTVFDGLFFQFSVIVLMIASIGTLILNAVSRPGSSYSFLLKWIVAVLLGGISIFVVEWLMTLFGSAYSTLFSSTGFSWYNFLNFSSYPLFSHSSNIKNGTLGIIVEFFAMTGYFVSVTSLFAFLMLRQALMLFSIVILPFATILGSTGRGKRLAGMMWEIIIEMSFYPFLVLLSLYLAHIFGPDVPLQLAFLFLPSIIPGLLFTTGNSFLSAPVLGFLGGLSFSGVAGKAIDMTSLASKPFMGESLQNTMKNGLTLPLKEKNSLEQMSKNGAAKEEMPWKTLLDEELKYRKEGVN